MEVEGSEVSFSSWCRACSDGGSASSSDAAGSPAITADTAASPRRKRGPAGYAWDAFRLPEDDRPHPRRLKTLLAARFLDSAALPQQERASPPEKLTAACKLPR